MSRHRYISTDISTDTNIAALAEMNPVSCLLYTWAIPHADDWGRMSGDARQFRLTVCPALDMTNKEVDGIIDQIASVGLWERYEIDGKQYIAFPQSSWWRHQNYISQAKRDDDKSQIPPPPPKNTHCRELPQNPEDSKLTQQNTNNFNELPPNTTSSSVSSSSSVSPSVSVSDASLDVEASLASPRETVQKNAKDDTSSPSSLLAYQVATRAGLKKFSADTWLKIIENYQANPRAPDIFMEIDKAKDWLEDHNATSPRKKRSMNVAFLDNWLKRAIKFETEETPYEKPSNHGSTATIGRAQENHRGVFQTPARTPYPGSPEYWEQRRQQREAVAQQGS